MANISIIDTGYANIETEGTVETLISNSGNEIELKGVRITYNRGNNTDDTVGPDSDNVEVNQVSTPNPRITIQGIMMRGKLDGTTTDLAQSTYLDLLCLTKGIKCVYYNDDLTDNTGYPLISKFLGVSKSGSTETLVNGTKTYTLANPNSHPDEIHFHCRFTNFRITQTANNAYSFTLEGVLTF